MKFPVYINLYFFKVHPHVFFEMLAYFTAARIYGYQRKKLDQKYNMTFLQKIVILYGMIFGAFILALMTSYMQEPVRNIKATLDNPLNLLSQGKTIVGGIFGGILGIETGKKIVKITQRTGDAFVLPLICGMLIGRLGCFFSGLEDNTVGKATATIFGIDFGDGIKRHPAQLYEILFFGVLLIIYLLYSKKIKGKYPNGFLFQLLAISYFIFRFFIDFLKPYPGFYFGMNSIQILCIIAIIYYIFVMRKTLLFEDKENFNVN